MSLFSHQEFPETPFWLLWRVKHSRPLTVINDVNVHIKQDTQKLVRFKNSGQMLCWWNMFRTNVDTGMSWDQTPRAVRILLVHQHCGGVFQAVCPWTLCWAAVWRGVETSWRCSQRAQPSAPSPTSATLFWTPLELLDGSEPEWHYWHLGYSWDGWITGRLNLIYFVYRWGPNTGEDAFYEQQPIVFIFWHAMTDMNTFLTGNRIEVSTL